jgi:hypothetical protein
LASFRAATRVGNESGIFRGSLSLPGADSRDKDLKMPLDRMKKPIQTTLVTIAPQ